MFGEKAKDLLLGASLLAVGLFALFSINTSVQIQISSGRTINFATMPSIWAGLLVFLSLLFIANALSEILAERRRRAEGEGEPTSRDTGWYTGNNRITVIRMVGTLVLLIAYIFLLQYANFAALTTIFLFSMFLLYGQTSLKKNAVVAICGGIGFYLLFIYFLKLPI